MRFRRDSSPAVEPDTGGRRVIIRPRNWKSFQHYSKRRPTWIKLHRDLLDNFEFHRLPVASKALAPFLWLLASESPNATIDADPDKLAFRLRTSAADISTALKPLIDSVFFEVASSPLAARLQNGVSERETERETEGEGDARAREPVSRGAIDAGDALTRSAEDVLAEITDAWKRDVDGVNVEALQKFFDFVARDISPPTKRRDVSPSARISIAKKLAGMGNLALQAEIVEQSIGADHAQLYPLKDRPNKPAQDAAKRQQSEQRELMQLKTRAKAIGFRDFDPAIDDLGGYRTLVEREESQRPRRNGGPKPIGKLLGGRAQ